MSYQVGIDLGTTYTAAAVHRDGAAAIFSLGGRAASIPSVVLLREDETVLTGEAAVRRAMTEPERVAREFKRRLGDTTPIIVGGSPYSAEALMARLLKTVLGEIETREGEAPTHIAVSHPANWGPYKHDLLDQAIRLAGLNTATVSKLSEPEASAISYAHQERVDVGQVVAVYDLGGGTFDACVLRRTADGFEIIGQPEGIERLGGIDFDAAVFAHVAKSLDGALAALDPDDPAVIAAVARLRADCVDAKEGLSSDTDARIPVLLPNLQTEVRITRREFEGLIRPSLVDSIEAMRRAIRSAGLEPEQVSKVLLVGGSSRIPLVAQMVSSELGRPIAVDAHPKHATAIGAAYAAASAAGEGPAVAAPTGLDVPTPPIASPASTPAASPAPTGSPVSMMPPPDAGTSIDTNPTEMISAVPPRSGTPATPASPPAPAAPSPPAPSPPAPSAAGPSESAPVGSTPLESLPSDAVPTPYETETTAIPVSYGGPTGGLGADAGDGYQPPGQQPPRHQSESGGTSSGGSKVPLLAGLGVVLLLLIVGGVWALSGGDDNEAADGDDTQLGTDNTSSTEPEGSNTTEPGTDTPDSTDPSDTTEATPPPVDDAMIQAELDGFVSQVGADDLSATVDGGDVMVQGTLGTGAADALLGQIEAIEGVRSIDQQGLLIVQDDEWCSPEVKATERWVCLNSVTWDAATGTLRATYDHAVGLPFTTDGGYHFHFFADDVEPKNAGVIAPGAQSEGGIDGNSGWEVWDEETYETNRFASKPERLCGRIANSSHAIEHLGSGNCWLVQDA